MRSVLRSRVRHGRTVAMLAAVAVVGLGVSSGVGATTVPDDTTENAGSPDGNATTAGSPTTAPDGTTAGTTGSAEATSDPCAVVSAPTDPVSSGPTDTATTGTATDVSGTEVADTPPTDTGGSTATSASPTPLELTLTDSAIDGLPDDLTAGVADVTVTDETASSGGEVNFTLVEPGTEAATFVEDLAVLFEGGPFPDSFLNTSGTTGGMVTIAEGEYIVWIDLAANEDRPSTVEDIVTAPLTVTAGDPMPVIPDTNDRVRSGDYLFDADIVPCDSTITFTNSSDNQFHHVIVVDFGTNDPVLVEENLPALLDSGPDSPPPTGIDMSQVNFDFANSGVFGPDASGTFEADFQQGNTYALLCFIQDREGGAPHAIQHQMYDVITVGT